jgi:hypothetical protein
MATIEDEVRTEQQAMVRLAKGTIGLISAVGATAAASGLLTYPTDPLDVTNHKRILARLKHDVAFTAGKMGLEFSDTTDFAEITFSETIDVNITQNPSQTRIGATIGADTTIYCADMDVETMGKYMRVKVRNDTAGTRTYDLDVRAKVN